MSATSPPAGFPFPASQVMDLGSVTQVSLAAAPPHHRVAHLAWPRPQFITARSHLANEVNSQTGTMEGKLFQRGKGGSPPAGLVSIHQSVETERPSCSSPSSSCSSASSSL